MATSSSALRGLLLLALIAGCASTTAELELSKGDRTLCIEMDTRWHRIPSHMTNLPLVVVDPLTACVDNTSVINNGADLSGKLAVIMRGSCFFSTKIAGAYANNASGVIILNTKNQSLIAPGASSSGDYKLYPIPMGMLSYDDGLYVLNQAETGVSGRLQSISMKRIDANSIIFMLLAVGCIYFGAIWASADLVLVDNNKRAETAPTGTDTEEAVVFSTRTALYMLCFASVMLLLMYFLYKYLVYIIISIFCISGAASLYRILHLAAEFALGKTSAAMTECLPVPWCGRLSGMSVALIGLSSGIAVWWAVERHAGYSWVLQDLLGCAFMITTIQAIRIPNLKVSTLLLSCFLVYDVFFVFITPYITKKHDSVMVTAATGGGASTETLPLVLRIPRLSVSPCFEGYSMLGFGDVIIPGLVVASCLSFDILRQFRYPELQARFITARYAYFSHALLAYILGLCATYMALALMDMAQPALLYLAPFVLGSMWLTAWCKGEMRSFWRGSLPGEIAAPVVHEDFEEDEVGVEQSGPLIDNDKY